MASQSNGEERIDIPPVPTHQTSSSSSNEEICSPRRAGISILFTANVIQIVVSIAVLWVSIADHGHPADKKSNVWIVGYAYGCAVMLPFLCFEYRCAGTLQNPRQRIGMTVFKFTMRFFFLVWYYFGLFCLLRDSSSSSHDEDTLESLSNTLLLLGSAIYSAPGSIIIIGFLFAIVASVAGSWVSIVQEHPDHKIIAWFVGYASGLALMLLLPCVGYITARIQNPCLDKVMEVFWQTLICSFFPVWSVFGFACFGGCSSSDGPFSSAIFLQPVLVVICALYATPGFIFAIYWLCDNGLVIWRKLKGAPDSPNAPLTYKFQSKENGGGVLLTAGAKRERTLSGEDAVCCICLGEYADNDELRELTCCSHFFHVECVDKWLKSKARCPLCQYEFGGAGGAATS